MCLSRTLIQGKPCPFTPGNGIAEWGGGNSMPGIPLMGTVTPDLYVAREPRLFSLCPWKEEDL